MGNPSVSSRWLRLGAAATTVLCLLAVAVPVGAASTPVMIKNINLHGSSNPTQLTQVGNTLFFAANDGVHGIELWKSDGTSAGTKMVKDIRPHGASSYPSNLINVNGTLFFTARDGVHGNELWKSDGTKAGTVMVKDLNPYPSGEFCGGGIWMPYPPVAVGSRLFFFDQCGGFWSGVLYVSDGTAAGTRWLDTPTIADLIDYDISGRVADTLGGKLFFVVGGCSDACEGPAEIWVTNGTNSGTHRMAGSPTADNIAFLPAHGTKLYFLTYNTDIWGENPVPDRLWRTDGTAAGTKPLTSAGELATAPSESVLLGTHLYFNDDALWKTNGTALGTKKISNGALTWLTKAGNKLSFARDTDLWKSDGTAAGTVDLGKFGAGWPKFLIGVGDKLCFAQMDASVESWSLWESNGTSGGTHKVRSFVPTFVYDEWVLQQAAVGSRLFFAAGDGVHGVELWRYTP